MRNDGVVVIIPSLNPDYTLVKLVSKLIECGGFESIIVVDDGSRHDLQHIFDDVSMLGQGCKVLHHIANMGKGAALKTAFEYYKNNYDKDKYVGVITADADGQHLVADIDNVANEFIKCTRGGGQMSCVGNEGF